MYFAMKVSVVYVVVDPYSCIMPYFEGVHVDTCTNGELVNSGEQAKHKT